MQKDSFINVRVENSLLARLLALKLRTDIPTSIFIRKTVERALAQAESEQVGK